MICMLNSVFRAPNMMFSCMKIFFVAALFLSLILRSKICCNSHLQNMYWTYCGPSLYQTFCFCTWLLTKPVLFASFSYRLNRLFTEWISTSFFCSYKLKFRCFKHAFHKKLFCFLILLNFYLLSAYSRFPSNL